MAIVVSLISLINGSCKAILEPLIKREENTMKVIRWTNRFSKETGFVKALAEDHFINTWEKADAAKYRTKKDAEKVLVTLNEFGENVNNEFVVE